MTVDFRLPRAEAREHVVAEDAWRRERMPIFRKQPPLTYDEIEAGLAFASARHAFWRGRTESRPVEEALAGATRGQVVAYCVPYSHADICDGGFHQYFSNLGQLASVTTEALVAIGEIERARLMTLAMSRFPKGVAPRSRAECQRLLGAIDYRADWRPWIDPIETAYYALGDDELDRRVRNYVSSHPNDFFRDD